jgi:hypothetical protein
MGARAAGFALVTYAAIRSIGPALSCVIVANETGQRQSCEDRTDDAIAYGGLALAVAGAIYDLATAPSSVRAWNHKHRALVQLAPTPLTTSHGSQALGFGVVGRF